MKKLLLSAGLLALALCAKAEDMGEPSLCITTKDGQTAVYALREKPLVTFNGDDVVVKTEAVQIQYEFAELESLTVINTIDDEDAIRRIPADATQFEVTAESLTAGSLKPGEEIQFFGVDGKRIASARADQEGRVVFPLTGIDTGVVIVKTQSFTYKIQKQ